MSIPRPLYFFAIALLVIPLISVSTSSTASAQADVVLDLTNDTDPCEELTEAAEAKEGATIVSGIDAEEADTPPPAEALEATINSGVDPDIFFAVQVISVETQQLTFPSGVLTLSDDEGNFATFVPGQPLTLVSDFVGTPEPFTIPVNGNLSFEPDPALGAAFGFCFTGFGPETIARVFDGDTLIGELTTSDPGFVSTSFIAEPGQTITRIEFDTQVLFVDLAVGFCEPEPEPEPEPPVVELSKQECLEAIAMEVGALADAATDPYEVYALNVACAALHFSAKDKFYEEGGNRLTAHGGNVFTGAAYAICYLEHTGVEGTEDIVDRIVDKLEEIVDCEIEYAIANGGTPQFIERAEEFAEVAEWIDEELDNPVVATIAYKLAWANAYFATY